MKNFSIPVKNILNSKIINKSNCWKVLLNNDVIVAFTDFQYDIKFEEEPDVIYKCNTGFNKAAVQQNSDLSINNSEIDTFLDSDQIKQDDVLAGFWQGAYYYEFQSFPDLRKSIEWDNVNKKEIFVFSTEDIIEDKTGQIGDITQKNKVFVAELRGLTNYLDINIGRIYQPACSLNLGDSKCKINLTQFTFLDQQITEVFSRSKFSVISDTIKPDGFFNYGRAVFTTGKNLKIKRDIKFSLSDGTICLQIPLPFDIQELDEVNLIAGCSKSKDECKEKFKNFENYNGFLYMPGIDKLGRGIIELK